MNGQLSEHPLAELIREITCARLTGALRLERERVKVVVYFETGEIVFATSNLRTHRLGEILKRSAMLTPEQFASLDQTIDRNNDAALEVSLINEGLLKKSRLEKVRVQQVSDVLRTALVWIDGQWQYDPRVRLAEKVRAKFDFRPLLMECARRLPRGFILSRFPVRNEVFSRAKAVDNGLGLLPAEAFLLSRVEAQMPLNDLTALSGLRDAEALRIAYALALAGLLHRTNWPTAMAGPAMATGKAPTKDPDPATASPAPPPKRDADDAAAIKHREERELEAMLARVSGADNYYEVLDVGRGGSISEIKHAYHKLARRFHPDKFHKVASRDLHARVETAFARIAQAYQTLGDLALRSAYDGKLAAQETARRATADSRRRSVASPTDAPLMPLGKGAKPESPDKSRAEIKFQQGLAALSEEKQTLAVRCFAEAAQLAPGEARYRAHYGNALIAQPQGHRLAVTELQTAIALDPTNASYHVMLARLCLELGFSRRAQTALEKALVLEPGNEAARELLRTLQ